MVAHLVAEHEGDLVVGAHLVEERDADGDVGPAVLALGLVGVRRHARVGVEPDAEVAPGRRGAGVLLAAEALGRRLDAGGDAGEVGRRARAAGRGGGRGDRDGGSRRQLGGHLVGGAAGGEEERQEAGGRRLHRRSSGGSAATFPHPAGACPVTTRRRRRRAGRRCCGRRRRGRRGRPRSRRRRSWRRPRGRGAAVSGAMPPSTWSQIGRSPIMARSARSFGQHRRQEGLAAEAGVDGHHQDEVALVEHVLDRGGRRRGVERHAGLRAELADAREAAVEVRAGLGVDGDEVGAGGDEGLEEGVGGRDHQVRRRARSACAGGAPRPCRGRG